MHAHGSASASRQSSPAWVDEGRAAHCFHLRAWTRACSLGSERICNLARRWHTTAWERRYCGLPPSLGAFSRAFDLAAIWRVTGQGSRSCAGCCGGTRGGASTLRERDGAAWGCRRKWTWMQAVTRSPRMTGVPPRHAGGGGSSMEGGSGRRLPMSALGYSDGGSTAGARAIGPRCTSPRALWQRCQSLSDVDVAVIYRCQSMDAREGINRCSSEPVSTPARSLAAIGGRCASWCGTQMHLCVFAEDAARCRCARPGKVTRLYS